MSRPLGHQLHAWRVGKHFQFDYLYIDKSNTQDEYTIILKGNFSAYVFLRSFESANAKNTANTLREYFSIFTLMLDWFSDQSRLFQNIVLEILPLAIGYKHRFSTAYVPWSNGTVQSVCKYFLLVMRALCAELRIPRPDWHKVVLSIHKVINSSPSRSWTIVLL